MEILDGKQTALQIKKEICTKVNQWTKKGIRVPHLGIIIVGDDPASHTYVKGKINACKEVGFDFTLTHFASSISEKKLIHHINQLNQDTDIDGFIVQIPLPPHIDIDKVTEAILPIKDVDGFTNQNFGSIVSNRPLLMPATPLGIIELIQRYNISTKGANVVVVGGSRVVGSPLSLMLQHHGDATVTVCNKHTPSIQNYTKEADILIVAVGKPNLITKDMVKKGAIVIDVGTTRLKDATKKSGFRIAGDVDFENVAPNCSMITPVPGGVGPMTIASLLLNTLKAYEYQNS